MKKFIAFMLVILMCVTMFTGCASWQRSMKSTVSDFTGGLYRRVTVYDYEGEPIKSWEGKFDVSETTTETYFDINGKRVIIQGGIIINEELPSQAIETPTE